MSLDLFGIAKCVGENTREEDYIRELRSARVHGVLPFILLLPPGQADHAWCILSLSVESGTQEKHPVGWTNRVRIRIIDEVTLKQQCSVESRETKANPCRMGL